MNVYRGRIRGGRRAPAPAIHRLSARPWLDELNPQQVEAVMHGDGPLLILAGAGTGKTRTLMARIAQLLTGDKGAGRAPLHHHRFLAVTFTNKAAREMHQRLEKNLGCHFDYRGPQAPFMGTFHSIGARLLRDRAERVGLERDFSILDPDDQLRLCKQIIGDAGLDDKAFPPRQLRGCIDHWKSRAWTVENLPATEAAVFKEKGKGFYAEYQKRLRDQNAADFGDLLLHLITIFQNRPDVLERYRRQFQHILVDEYQDINTAQYLFLRWLADGHGNICCAGDEDQSIYGWRGAEVGHILRFEEQLLRKFPNVRIIKLEQNYRSTGHILASANGIIGHNRGRREKALWTAAGDSEKVRKIDYPNGDEEARRIGEEIEALQQNGFGTLPPVNLNDVAILVRTTRQMRAFEEQFFKFNLPLRVIGGARFYERAEIRDAMAYLRMIDSSRHDLAFARVVNVPKRGIGSVTQQKIRQLARRNHTSLLRGAELLVEHSDGGGRKTTPLRQLLEHIRCWQKLLESGEVGHVALARRALEEAGYIAMLERERDETSLKDGTRLDNINELFEAMEEFPDLRAFLEHTSLVMETSDDVDTPKVSIMTLHAAKGLEFDVVYLPGWENGLFPSLRTLEERGDAAEEEERRLAYVGITRAGRLCSISFCHHRHLHGRLEAAWPSRFLNEIPAAHVDELALPGGYVQPYARMPSGIEARAARADGYASPGWKRMQTRGIAATPASLRPTRAWAEPVACFDVGDRVFHQKFGYGSVLRAEGQRLEVAFEKADTKMVMASYLSAA